MKSLAHYTGQQKAPFHPQQPSLSWQMGESHDHDFEGGSTMSRVPDVVGGVGWVLLLASVPAVAQTFDIDAFVVESPPGIAVPEAQLGITNNDPTYWYRVAVKGLAVNDGPASKDDCDWHLQGEQCAGDLACAIEIEGVITCSPGATCALGGSMPVVDNSGDPDTCQSGCSHCDNEGEPYSCVAFETAPTFEIIQYKYDGGTWTRLTTPIPLSYTTTNDCE